MRLWRDIKKKNSKPAIQSAVVPKMTADGVAAADAEKSDLKKAQEQFKQYHRNALLSVRAKGHPPRRSHRKAE